jgi:hypothetical protein
MWRSDDVKRKHMKRQITGQHALSPSDPDGTGGAGSASRASRQNETCPHLWEIEGGVECCALCGATGRRNL